VLFTGTLTTTVLGSVLFNLTGRINDGILMDILVAFGPFMLAACFVLYCILILAILAVNWDVIFVKKPALEF
jgi:hypothetical protein